MIHQTETPDEPWYPDSAYEAAEWIKACLLQGCPIEQLDGEIRVLIDLVIEESE